MGFTHRRAGVLVWVGVLLVAAVGAPVAGAVPSVSPGDASEIVPQRGDGASPANNTSVQQEDPESVDSSGNVSELQSWFSGRLSQTVVNCSEGLTVGEYDACNRSDGEYPEWLSGYVNVTRESDSGDNRTNAFERTRENQTEYASKVRRFRNTVEAYNDARNDSDTQRARRLARRAQTLATDINRTSGNLTRNYGAIANGTGRDLSPATRTTRNVSRNVTTTAASLSIEQFRNTTITARGADRVISFSEPLRVTGRVAAANGTGLADRTVGIRVDGRIRGTTTTNATGVYRLTYRPTRAPLDTERVTLQYLPRNRSVYSGNETSVPVDIRQVEPTLRATGGSNAVSYGGPVTVDGSLAVDGIGARGMPVAVSVDGEELRFEDGTRARTASNGGFRLSARLPKEVNDGRRSVRVSLPLENRALARDNVSIPLTVRSTPTALSVNATQTSVNGSNVSGPVVRLAGRLTTNGDQAVRNESVALAVNDTTTTTVTTDENGSYDANVSVPESLFAGRTGTVPIAIGARYAGVETSLEASTARTRLRIDVPAQPTPRFLAELLAFLAEHPWYVGVPVVVLVLGLGYAIVRIRDGSDADQASTTTDPAAEGGSSTGETTEDWGSLLDAANHQLFTGDRAGAVATAYAATRRKLRDDLGLGGAYTHWEFLDAARNAVGDRRGAALGRLTELYERAAFSPYDLSEGTAGTAIDDAETVTGDGSDEHTGE
ncbi:hypothetical protein [Halococcus sp. IIIV-5B]|uniref:hypothetical protein n=1 Tax=Halococcus sp. IIIV-5B TaxID=2321230 RepID=UPI000E71D1ED|nr:hypothetical protein [Halococcus sp. IIIV-5B]RJT05254.1 hypothetical protein D3261_07685 [Halococcus sp. IIIV-5B]